VVLAQSSPRYKKVDPYGLHSYLSHVMKNNAADRPPPSDKPTSSHYFLGSVPLSEPKHHPTLSGFLVATDLRTGKEVVFESNRLRIR
jgi:hypothetical protein